VKRSPAILIAAATAGWLFGYFPEMETLPAIAWNEASGAVFVRI
jgi:hypothetical protein